jgi:hypothetical protein
MAARNVPISQAKWSWDCTTPQTALTGTFVSAGAVVFLLRATEFLTSFKMLDAGSDRIVSWQGVARAEFQSYHRKLSLPGIVRRLSSPSHIRIMACTANVSDVGRY